MSSSIMLRIQQFLLFWKPEKPLDWLQYRSDSFRNVIWQWEYVATEDRHYTVSNLKPVCPQCLADALTYQDGDEFVIGCAACDEILDSHMARESGYIEAIHQLIHGRILEKYGMDCDHEASH